MSPRIELNSSPLLPITSCILPINNLPSSVRVFEHSRSMLFNSEVVPTSSLVLVYVPALNQLIFESAVQGDIENVEAG
ncbi:hypothetical protein J6590_072276 [Homalodisca vitripennis]|nr:hypothetical protein J6590_072276 [Homalodisca vitripennis]